MHHVMSYSSCFIHLFTHLGNIYIADYQNSRVRKLTVSTGMISLVMTGTAPWGVAVDASGNVYTADYASIKKYTSSTAATSTFAGISGSYGYSGDGGAATSATFSDVFGIAVDSSGRHITYTSMYVRLFCHF